MGRYWAVLVGLIFWCGAALAQAPDDVVWVQIEAHSSLAAATSRARVYAEDVEDVNGFALAGGWYAVVLGPYRRDDAELVLRAYRRAGLIAADSFISGDELFRQQFWPIGANILTLSPSTVPRDLPEENTEETPQPAPEEPIAEAPPQPERADETPAEARQSERLLSRAEREELQIALRWAGVYSGAIDGAFGRGTRGAMTAWQINAGFEATGVLTTAQRAELLRQYNAVFEGLGLRLVTDSSAGIEVQLPMEVVTFERYASPFAHYDGTGVIPQARMLLISQPGDRNALQGLFDVMQTLEIVPLDGKREITRDSFVLIGENEQIVSETRVSLEDGALKGFTLVWPAGDETRRTRLLERIEASFRTLPGTLDLAAGDDSSQTTDLISGLAIRVPRLSRSGFFVSNRGDVVTISEAVDGCARITLDDHWRAIVVQNIDGIALLRPDEDLAPLGVASLSTQTPRPGDLVAIGGYSYEGLLNAPSVTFGTIEDAKSLGGDPSITRFSADLLAGDAGGPVLDRFGAVIGMALPKAQLGRTLPKGTRYATKLDRIFSAEASEIDISRPNEPAVELEPEDIAEIGSQITVLVGCWD